jgi:hypothetical protein
MQCSWPCICRLFLIVCDDNNCFQKLACGAFYPTSPINKSTPTYGMFSTQTFCHRVIFWLTKIHYSWPRFFRLFLIVCDVLEADFCLFSFLHVQIHYIAPIHNHRHRPAPIYVPKCPPSAKIFLGKIPPTIGQNPCPVRPILAMIVLFFFTPVPMYPVAPVRTHLHPFTHICTPSHPWFQCIDVRFIFF